MKKLCVAMVILMVMSLGAVSASMGEPQLENSTVNPASGRGFVTPRVIGQSFILETDKLNSIELGFRNVGGLANFGEDGGIEISIYKGFFNEFEVSLNESSLRRWWSYSKPFEPVATVFLPGADIEEAWENRDGLAWVNVPVNIEVEPNAEYAFIMQMSDKNEGNPVIEWGMSHGEVEATYPEFKYLESTAGDGNWNQVQNVWQLAFRIY